MIDNTEINVLIDSGFSINIIDETTYKKIHPKPRLTATKSKVFPYQASSPLKLLGKFNSVIQANDKFSNTSIIVVEGTGKSILSKDTAEQLDLLRVGPQITKPMYHIQPSTIINLILEKYKEVFEGHGMLKDTEIKLHINKDVTPVQQPIRRIPWHTRQKVSEELHLQEDYKN